MRSGNGFESVDFRIPLSEAASFLQQVGTEIKSRLSLSRCESSCLQRAPVYIVDTNLVVPALVRIAVWQNLPVEPRNTRCIDTRSPFLDIGIPGARGKWTAAVAVVVRGIGVARSPLLHDELLASVLCLVDIWLQFGGLKVASAVSVDGKDVQAGA